MNEVDLQKQIDELTKELKYAGEDTQMRLTQLRSEVDRIKLHVAALLRYLRSNMPGFEEEFQKIRDETAREINPEFYKGEKV